MFSFSGKRHARRRIGIRINTYKYIYNSVYKYTCIYKHIYIPKEKAREKNTEERVVRAGEKKHRDRERGRKSGKGRNIEKVIGGPGRRSEFADSARRGLLIIIWRTSFAKRSWERGFSR